MRWGNLSIESVLLEQIRLFVREANTSLPKKRSWESQLKFLFEGHANSKNNIAEQRSSC